MTWAFVSQELRRLLLGRAGQAIAALLVLAVLSTPGLVREPPPEVLAAVGGWFGAERPLLKLFLFLWIDVAMNKFVVLLGPVLAGGLIVAERARGGLDLYLSKPMTPAAYFAARLLAAALAGAALYAGATLLGAAFFSATVPGFAVGPFLALGAAHLGCAVFSVVLCGTVAAGSARRGTALLVSFLILLSLIGTAFMGFYTPALRIVGYVNPFYHGVAVFASLDHLQAADVLRPVAVLLAMNLAVAGLGIHRARRLCA